MYGNPSAGIAGGGAALAVTGGSVEMAAFGVVIAVVAVTLGVLLFVRERRRQQVLRLGAA